MVTDDQDVSQEICEVAVLPARTGGQVDPRQEVETQVGQTYPLPKDKVKNRPNVKVTFLEHQRGNRK